MTELRRLRARPPASTGRDVLGLQRALSDRLLPLLVGAMAFLAGLAIAGAVAAASLAHHWQEGAAASITVQVPQPGEPAANRPATRLDAVLAALRGAEGIAAAQPLTRTELDKMLRPWLGETGDIALPIPAVIAVRLSDTPPPMAELQTQLETMAPGTQVESHGLWVARLSELARSLQACGAIAVLIVLVVAIALITVSTRAGLAARRDAIEIVHGLGASDGFIAARFAGRMTRLCAYGGVIGAVLALPALLALAQLAAPFVTWDTQAGALDQAASAGSWAQALATLPGAVWGALPCLPIAAAGIGWLTAQITVRGWLRRLP